jgi:hypothetical protein
MELGTLRAGKFQRCPRLPDTRLAVRARWGRYHPRPWSWEIRRDGEPLPARLREDGYATEASRRRPATWRCGTSWRDFLEGLGGKRERLDGSLAFRRPREIDRPRRPTRAPVGQSAQRGPRQGRPTSSPCSGVLLDLPTSEHALPSRGMPARACESLRFFASHRTSMAVYGSRGPARSLEKSSLTRSF